MGDPRKHNKTYDIGSSHNIRGIVDYFCPIHDEEVKYLRTCLDEAKTLEVGSETKTCPRMFSNLGTVTLYYADDAGPTVELTPKDWKDISPVDYARLLEYASNVIKDQGYYGKLNFDENFEEKDPKTFQITFQEKGTSTYAILIDQESINVYSREGIKILQGIWNQC